MVSSCKVFIREKRLECIMNTPTFSDPAPCRCYVIGRISNTSIDANTSIDTTDKARGREGGKKISTDKIYLGTFHLVRTQFYVVSGPTQPLFACDTPLCICKV